MVFISGFVCPQGCLAHFTSRKKTKNELLKVTMRNAGADPHRANTQKIET